jgi:hypothetical protein
VPTEQGFKWNRALAGAKSRSATSVLFSVAGGDVII